MASLIIDCDSCLVRGPGCAQCVVSALLEPTDHWEMSEEEERAVVTLASVGLIPGIGMRARPPRNGTEG